MKSAVIVFPFMLFCMMPTHLYSLDFATVEIIGLNHSFVSSPASSTDKLLFNGISFGKLNLLKNAVTNNFYVGGGFTMLYLSSDILVSSNVKNTSKIVLDENADLFQFFLSALYSVSDGIYIKLDVDLINLFPIKPFVFYSKQMYANVHSNYLTSAFANIGSPTLSFGFNPIGAWGITIYCKYNHNAILNNWLNKKFHSKVLEAHETLRDEYKSILPVDDINYLFKNANMSYFTIGIGLGVQQ